MKVPDTSILISFSDSCVGTIFIPTTVDNITAEVQFLESLNLPEVEGRGSVARAFDEVMKLYPDDPALGSPFGSGNNTFGLSPVFKRVTAITGNC